MAFWNKDAQTRIDETLAFILAKIPPGERGVADAFLKRRVAASGPDLSKVMSTSTSTNAGNKDERAARRALVIMAGDMMVQKNPNWRTAAQIMAMSPMEVTSLFNKLIVPFRVFVTQEGNQNALLNNVLNDLKTMTEPFLRNNTLVTQSARFKGSNGTTVIGTGGAIDHRFYYSYKTGAYHIVPTSSHGIITETGGITFRAINVPEILWFDVPGRGLNPATGSFANMEATEMTGADMMVTSAFDGCSFCFKASGRATYASHIGPSGVVSGAGPSIGAPPTLAMQLGGPQGTGNFGTPQAAQAGTLKVFGLGYSNISGLDGGYSVDPGPKSTGAEKMTIIGVRNGDFWKFVTQDASLGTRKVSILT